MYNPEEFETTGNISQKKGTVKPKASTYNDDNLSKCDISQRQEKFLLNFQNSGAQKKTIIRRSYKADVVFRRFVKIKSRCSLRQTSKAEWSSWKNMEILMIQKRWADKSISQLCVDGLERCLWRNTRMKASLSQLNVKNSYRSISVARIGDPH